MVALRRLAPVLAVLVLLGGCRWLGFEPPGLPDPGRSPQGPGGGSPSGGSPAAPPGGAPAPASIDDAGPLGSAARLLLRSEPFTEIAVEIDHVRGRRPDARAVDHLLETLRAVTGKRVTLEGGDELPPGDGSWTAGEIRRLAAGRTVRSEAPRASLWIGYLDGSLAEGPGALGVAAGATVAAIFPDRISDALTALVLPGAIERSVLVHEAGHLLALVNIGYRSAIDREDPEHPHHSHNRGSVMYWAVEDVSVASLLGGGPPDRFDEADLEDLRMLGS